MITCATWTEISGAPIASRYNYVEKKEKEKENEHKPSFQMLMDRIKHYEGEAIWIYLFSTTLRLPTYIAYNDIRG